MANLGLLAGFDISADSLCLALDGFGGDLDAGQKFQLLPALIKARFAADHSHHSAHSRRIGDAFHIQFPVARTLAFTAMPADIISTIEVEWPQHAEQLLPTLIMIVGLLSAPASHLYGMPAILGQQARQNRRSRPMQSSACRHLDCFHVQYGIS